MGGSHTSLKMWLIPAVISLALASPATNTYADGFALLYAFCHKKGCSDGALPQGSLLAD